MIVDFVVCHILTRNLRLLALVRRITALTLAAAANRLHFAAAHWLMAVDLTGQRDGRTDTRPLHRRLLHTMRPASINH